MPTLELAQGSPNDIRNGASMANGDQVHVNGENNALSSHDGDDPACIVGMGKCHIS